MIPVVAHNAGPFPLAARGWCHESVSAAPKALEHPAALPYNLTGFANGLAHLIQSPVLIPWNLPGAKTLHRIMSEPCKFPLPSLNRATQVQDKLAFPISVARP